MDLKNIEKLDQQYFMPVFGQRLPVAFETGEGACLYDNAGKKYTDFLAGIAVNSLGYSDEGFKNAIKAQADKLLHTSNYFYNEPQARLAEALCGKTGMKGKVFFGNSGAEANECAIKLAKKYAYNKRKGSAEFVSVSNSFHGRTLATLTATGQDSFHIPFTPGTYEYTYIDANDMNAARAAVTPKTCGVIVEVIQGEGGIIPLDFEYLKLLEKLCKDNDALLIADEIQTGMGRTGKFLACEHAGLKPDIVTLAKALGNGVPIGACIAADKAAEAFVQGDHGSTFGGNYLACAAGLYVVGAVDNAMMEAVAEKGAYFKSKLEGLKDKKPDTIVDVRGMGLLLGAELSAAKNAAEVKMSMLEKGFVIGTAGQNTLRFVPPYVIEKNDIDDLAEALIEVL